MKITPETAPVGARLLVRRFTQLSEITVLEWSPSGTRMKYRPATNPKAEIWSEELPQQCALVERLPETGDGAGVGGQTDWRVPSFVERLPKTMDEPSTAEGATIK